MIESATRDAIALRLATIAREAGQLLLELKKTRSPVSHKSDNTPTCPADTASEALIIARLRTAFAATPIISEERVKDTHQDQRFFLVDPLDGTADFIAGGDEFCVNIALIEQGRPVASVIHAPVSGISWLAGEGVGKLLPGEKTPQAIHSRPVDHNHPVALTSNRYGDAETETCLDTLPPVERRRISSAIKFCLIAEGEADLYIRHGRTMEWDTAAGDLILTRAGGTVIGLDGLPLGYGRRDEGYANQAFIAMGDKGFAPAALAACRSAFRSA